MKATVSAKYSGTELVEGTDYTVEQTTTAEGIEVKLNGIGDFGGSVTKTIKAEDIAVSDAKNLTVKQQKQIL